MRQLLNGYIEQARVPMSGNGAFGSSGTGPASGYFLMNFLVHCVFSVVSITCFMLVATNTNVFVSVHAFVYVMFYSIFRIKLNRKMPLILSAATEAAQRTTTRLNPKPSQVSIYNFVLNSYIEKIAIRMWFGCCSCTVIAMQLPHFSEF